MCTYCGVDDGHPRTQCPTRQEREIGTDRQLDAPLESCPDCGTANNRSVNKSCWKCGHEFTDRELVTDGGTVEDWHGTEAPASVDGVDLLDADACPACESTGSFFEGPAGYFTCERCHSTWAGDAGDAEIVTYLEWSDSDQKLVTDGGTDTVIEHPLSGGSHFRYWALTFGLSLGIAGLIAATFEFGDPRIGYALLIGSANGAFVAGWAHIVWTNRSLPADSSTEAHQ